MKIINNIITRVMLKKGLMHLTEYFKYVEQKTEVANKYEQSYIGICGAK